jgi:periplasmic divalent cation tolerance protein
MGKDFVIIMVTCASAKEAQRIADRVLAKRLAACANIVDGVRSKFWWKGKLDSAEETLVMMKTSKANFKKIENEIKKLHSYEVPEIIAVPVAAGSKEYLKWIDDNIYV